MFLLTNPYTSTSNYNLKKIQLNCCVLLRINIIVNPSFAFCMCICNLRFSTRKVTKNPPTACMQQSSSDMHIINNVVQQRHN